MDLTILPTKKIINTYKRYSLPVAEKEPTDISKLQFFYIGNQASNAARQESFEFGYTGVSAESAINEPEAVIEKAGRSYHSRHDHCRNHSGNGTPGRTA